MAFATRGGSTPGTSDCWRTGGGSAVRGSSGDFGRASAVMVTGSRGARLAATTGSRGGGVEPGARRDSSDGVAGRGGRGNSGGLTPGIGTGDVRVWGRGSGMVAGVGRSDGNDTDFDGGNSGSRAACGGLTGGNRSGGVTVGGGVGNRGPGTTTTGVAAVGDVGFRPGVSGGMGIDFDAGNVGNRSGGVVVTNSGNRGPCPCGDGVGDGGRAGDRNEGRGGTGSGLRLGVGVTPTGSGGNRRGGVTVGSGGDTTPLGVVDGGNLSGGRGGGVEASGSSGRDGGGVVGVGSRGAGRPRTGGSCNFGFGLVLVVVMVYSGGRRRPLSWRAASNCVVSWGLGL